MPLYHTRITTTYAAPGINNPMRFKQWLLITESVPDDLGVRLKRFFSSNAPYEVLDACSIDGTFQAGACWVGAEVIIRYLAAMGVKAELYAVWDRGQAFHDEDEFSPEPIQQHVVVKVGDSYLDSDGVHTAAQMVNKMVRYEGLQNPKLAPFDPKTAGEIITNKSAVNRIYKRLVQALGDPSAK